MLDKLEKIEAKINEGLGKVFKVVLTLLLKFFDAIIPNFIQEKFLLTKSKLISKKNKGIKFTKSKLSLFKDQFTTNKTKLFDKIDEIQKFPVKEKGIEKALEFKNFILSTPPKNHLNNFKVWSQSQMKKIFGYFIFVKTTQFKIATGLSLIGLMGFLTVFHSSLNIWHKEFPKREIASVQEYDYRPDYNFYENKTLQIQNVKVPIFVEEVGNISSITIDFSLRLSTKFSSYYLKEYEYRLKDYFFTSVEPVESDFPIHQEGKEVLKEAIMIEINNFLHDNNVEGEVLEVNILYMVGS